MGAHWVLTMTLQVAGRDSQRVTGDWGTCSEKPTSSYSPHCLKLSAHGLGVLALSPQDAQPPQGSAWWELPAQALQQP